MGSGAIVGVGSGATVCAVNGGVSSSTGAVSVTSGGVSSPGTSSDENAPAGVLADETVEEITAETYGPLKVLCEQAVEAALPGREPLSMNSATSASSMRRMPISSIIMRRESSLSGETTSSGRRS